MKNRSGFTLLETMIVVMIVSVVVALAYPKMVVYKKNSEFKSSIREIYSFLQNTRSTAIKRNRTITLNFNKVNNGKDSYIAFIDGDNDGVFDSDEDAIFPLKEFTPEVSFNTIKFILNRSIPVNVSYLRFDPLGFSGESGNSMTGELILKGYDEKKATIKIDTSGNIRIL